MINGLSFDIEDWFQVNNFEGIIPRDQWAHCEQRVVGNTEKILSLLHRKDVKATFFILGWVAEAAPDLIRKIYDGGHEIATHGHAHRRLTTLGPDEFRSDLQRSLTAIDAAGGGAVTGFRAPSFSVVPSTQWALPILQECGFDYDSSIFPCSGHPDYGMPAAPQSPYKVLQGLWEIPLTTVNLFGCRLPVAGGGYFRLFPYSFTRWAIRNINREQRPAVVYLHPWEFDPDQPRIKSAGFRRFRHYVNLDRTMPRLERLLNDFQFCTLQSLIRVKHTGEDQVAS